MSHHSAVDNFSSEKWICDSMFITFVMRKTGNILLLLLVLKAGKPNTGGYSKKVRKQK